MWINLFLFLFRGREDRIFIVLLTITCWYKVLKMKAFASSALVHLLQVLYSMTCSLVQVLILCKTTGN